MLYLARTFCIIYLSFLISWPAKASVWELLKACSRGFKPSAGFQSKVGFSPTFKTKADAERWLDGMMPKFISKDELGVVYTWPRANQGTKLNSRLREHGINSIANGSYGVMTPGTYDLETFNHRKVVSILDEIHRRTRIKKKIVAFRTIEKKDFIGLKVGDVTSDPGYTNLSVGKELPADWARIRKSNSHSISVTLVVTVPKNYPAFASLAHNYRAAMDGGDKTIVSEELELVLARNSQMRIDRIESKGGEETYYATLLPHQGWD